MGLGFTSYIVENDLAFARAVDRAAKDAKSLKVPFNAIARDFQKSRKAIFNLKGPGGYPDLSPKYKIQKQRILGQIYPILKLSGDLEKSVTDRNDSDNITRVGNDSLELGTSIEYGIYHQSDDPRLKIPLRKFLFIGPESTKFASSDLSGFPNRSLNTLNTFVLRSLGLNIEQATGVKPKVKQQRF